MSLYEDSPEREWRWLRGIWAGRAHVDQSWWRLYFVVMVDGEPAGMQDLLGVQFAALGTVGTFSWLGPGYRGRGIGTEMRAAVLHLAFAGLGAREATSEAFADNQASNLVSQTLAYQPFPALSPPGSSSAERVGSNAKRTLISDRAAEPGRSSLR